MPMSDQPARSLSDVTNVWSIKEDFSSIVIWSSFGVDKGGVANRNSRVEPVPKLMTDGWTVEAEHLKNH